MLRQIKKTVWHDPVSTIVLSCLWIMLTAYQAVAVETPREQVTRGQTLLLQAQSQLDSKSREQHLADAVKLFSKAYSQGRRTAKMHALIGAAQGYLLMRKAPAQFPFLWSAPPLPRAIKSLQHVLALQPENVAANLLMGVALWRQVELPSSSESWHHPSGPYLRQVIAAGVHVHLPEDQTSSLNTAPAVGYTVGDAILALRYVDARGTGSMADLLFIYTRGSAPYCFGVVVSTGTAHPLVSDATTGSMAMATRLTAINVTSETSPQPVISIAWKAPNGANQVHFQWNGESFRMVSSPQ